MGILVRPETDRDVPKITGIHHSAFEAPDEAFMALELVEGELSNKQGTVEYPLEYLDA